MPCIDIFRNKVQRFNNTKQGLLKLFSYNPGHLSRSRGKSRYSTSATPPKRFHRLIHLYGQGHAKDTPSTDSRNETIASSKKLAISQGLRRISFRRFQVECVSAGQKRLAVKETRKKKKQCLRPLEHTRTERSLKSASERVTDDLTCQARLSGSNWPAS